MAALSEAYHLDNVRTKTARRFMESCNIPVPDDNNEDVIKEINYSFIGLSRFTSIGDVLSVCDKVGYRYQLKGPRLIYNQLSWIGMDYLREMEQTGYATDDLDTLSNLLNMVEVEAAVAEEIFQIVHPEYFDKRYHMMICRIEHKYRAIDFENPENAGYILTFKCSVAQPSRKLKLLLSRRQQIYVNDGSQSRQVYDGEEISLLRCSASSP